MILGSVRNRLALAFFVIAAAAIGFVYLYVVPQLRSSLTTEKLQRLERVGTEQSSPLTSALRHGASGAEIRRLVSAVGQRTDARVALLNVHAGPDGARPRFVVGDEELRAQVPSVYPAATLAASSGRAASEVIHIAGTRTGETAVPLPVDGSPRWVAVLWTPLSDVDDNVALIRRQILIAGGIALLAALVAGWLAARAHAKRLGRLEVAAARVAEGDFSAPVPDEGNDEVGQLAATLNEMQTRLGQLDSARRDFIANASHELRTPIFALGGFVELLDEEEPDPAQRKEFVQTMRQQVARLTKLTADLLDLSKLDADAMKLNAERVDLGEIARRVAGRVRTRGRPAQLADRGPRKRSRGGDGRRRPGGADHAYPARQRAYAHAGGNLDLDHSAAAGRDGEPGRHRRRSRRRSPSAGAGLRALLHR